MKWAIIIFLSIIFLLPNNVYADSSYVLPYPSEMPGSKLYPIYQVFEKIEKYWYFGDFASYNYNLKYSDKYLVEAKTLFEYKQYLLASNALEKSDYYFLNVKESLNNSKNKNRNIKDKEQNLKDASLKHTEVLNQLSTFVPQEFDWTPEKRSPTKIKIGEKIEKSLKIRNL